MKISLKYIATMLLALLFMLGCISEVDKDMGSLTVRGKWPDKTTRLIPADTKEIIVTLYLPYKPGTTNDKIEKIIIRNGSETSFEVEFPDLEEGMYSLYLNYKDSNGNLILSTWKELIIKSGENSVSVEAGKYEYISNIFPVDGEEITPASIYTLKWNKGNMNCNETTPGAIFKMPVMYNIYFGTSPDLKESDKINAIPVESPQYQITDKQVTAGTVYYWKVVAINEAGESTSSTWSFKVKTGKSMNLINAGSNYNPQTLTIADDFYISPYETTQKEFSELMGFNPSANVLTNSAFEAVYPVENITWYDAVMFCNKLSEKEGLALYYDVSSITYSGISGASSITSAVVTEISTGNGRMGYRLPTQYEWEYAARGGDNGPSYIYSGSDDITTVGWYTSNSSGVIHEIRQKESNTLGLYDMTGNAAEFTGSEFATGAPEVTVKGGSFIDMDTYCINSYSGMGMKSMGQNFLGFRVARFK